MIQNDPLGGLRQGTAAVGALAKPLDAALPGAGTALQTMLQLASMSIPSFINPTPINPYNTNPMGVVGFRNLGGTLNGIPGYLYGENQDQQITRDAFKVQGNGGIDTNFRNVEGQNALLTQNEIVSKLKDGSNYVFSDHIKNPLTGNSLAKDAEKLKKKQKQAEDRVASGDLISKKTVGKIKEQVDELSQINDMALEVIKSTMGEQADAFLCGGKMKSKKYALGGVVKKVLGEASELPQQEPIPFPLMLNSSVDQIPVVRASRITNTDSFYDIMYGHMVEPDWDQTPQIVNDFITQLEMNGYLERTAGITPPTYPSVNTIPDPNRPQPVDPLADPPRPFVLDRVSPVMATPSPYNPEWLAKQMGPQPLATETPTGSIPTVTEEQLKQATGSSSGSGKGKGRSRSSNYVPGIEELKYGKPSDWKGYTTKEFQDFVRKQDPKALSKFGADGKWGSETETAWNKFGKAFLTSKGDFGVSGSPSIATIPPYPINQKNPDLKGPDTEKKDKESGDNFANFQKYIGDVMQGLAFAGQLGNLGTVEWENIPKMDLRQIDPAIYQEQLRAARNAQMQNVAGSYSTNQAGQQAAYSQYLNQLTQTLQQVDTTNKQLATETQSYNNQADVQQQIARMQALAAHDAAKQGIWGSFANAGMAINDQYSNKVGQAALASAYPLVYEGLMKDMQEFLSTNNKKKTKTSE